MNVDRVLIRQLEFSAIAAEAATVAAMRAVDPDDVAELIGFGGGALVATGPGRYVNRAMGVGLDPEPAVDLEEIERFFDEHHVTPAIEVSAWTDPSVIGQLNDRSYALGWFRSMFAVDLASWPDGGPVATPTSASIAVTAAAPDDLAIWQKMLADGNEIADPTARRISDDFAVTMWNTPGTHHHLARTGGETVGCGSIHLVDEMAWMGGMATLPAWRGRGVQAALIDHRLRLARSLGCKFALATAATAGVSARNLTRHGFQLTHTQVVMVRSDR